MTGIQSLVSHHLGVLMGVCLHKTLTYNPQTMSYRRYQRWLVIPAILIFYYLALNSLLGDSPTMDEQNHIARGLALLRTGDPRLSLEHPPLINAFSALPLLTMPEIELPFDDMSWQGQPVDVFWYVFADKMIWEVNRGLDLQKIFFLARLPIVYLTIALALIGWHFAREMWGIIPAILIFLLLLFDPNILAHGRYTTTDIGGTLFTFLATYFLWRLWVIRGWNWHRWFWAMTAIGLAFSSKLSSLIFMPIWILLALLPIYGHKSYLHAAMRRLGQLLLAGAGSLLILWTTYLFDWGTFNFLDQRLEFLNDFSGPMPPFWSGIERILLLSEGGRPSFLLGQFSNEGFPLYFPIALITKTPALTLILFFLAVVILILIKKTRPGVIFLLAPLIVYFGATIASALNIGYRHLLPILPYMYMTIAGLGSAPARSWIWQTFGGRRDEIGRFSWTPVLFIILLIINYFLIVGWIHPHYLSYFNEIAGGPVNGHEILIDSNIDWGQDLLRLERWMDENNVQEIKLGWFGTADPGYYGINYEPLPGFPRQPFLSRWSIPPFNPSSPGPGIYAISASSLGELPLPEKNVYPWFRARPPDDRVGYSIFIYEIPESEE